MAVVANRRSVMTLFSRPTDIHSHRTRLVLSEKNINIEISNVAGPDLPEDLMDLNPYHTVPTLVDRDLTLYDSRVIVEYLDERFPHPPLMPVDPVTRAQFRLALFRIETDWYAIAAEAETSIDGKKIDRVTNEIVVTPGNLESEDYDNFVRDTVNFLAYMTEPVRGFRVDLGKWVMMYLIFFLIIARMLKKQIWKEVK